MRKTICFVIVTIFLFTDLFGQKSIDSLRRLLTNANEDTARVKLMNQISVRYGESKPDSTFKYASEALVLSRKANYRKGEIYAMIGLSNAINSAGDYAKALEYSFEALKKSEALGSKEQIADCYWAIAVCYFYHRDVQQALPYNFKAKEIYEELHSELDLSGMLNNTGAAYIDLDELDSARYYLNQSLEISLRLKDEENIADVYMNMARIHAKLKEYDIGLAYYKQAIPTFIADSDYLFLYSSYYFLGGLFDSTRHYDSALYYSKLALITANKMNSPVSLVDINKQIASLFKRAGRLDSAFVYQEMAMIAKDSLTSQEKEKKMQLLTFNERLRQMDIAEQKRKDDEARKRNLELAGIAIFIPSFFFLVMLLGRRKVRSRTIEFLGVLSLLFLFEFIALFIHPYIGHWTNESQIWMLLILVAIAVVLVPLHHRLENWMKERLATKPKEELQSEAVQIQVNES